MADTIEQEAHEHDALRAIQHVVGSLPYTAPELRQPLLRTLAVAVGEVLEANGWTRELHPETIERIRVAEADAAEMRRQRDQVRGFLAEVHRSLRSFPRDCEVGSLADRAAQILEANRAKP